MAELSNKELIELIDNAITKFHGNSQELENAIGALMVGRKTGWKVLFLIHSPRSIKKYEGILGISFREMMPDLGPKADDSIAWSIAKKLSNFWKVVKGEVPEVKTADWKMIK